MEIKYEWGIKEEKNDCIKAHPEPWKKAHDIKWLEKITKKKKRKKCVRSRTISGVETLLFFGLSRSRRLFLECQCQDSQLVKAGRRAFLTRKSV